MRSSDNKWFLTRVKRTIYDYKMIADGGRVAIGISGGKDSAALLYIMKLFQKHSPLKVALVAIYVNLGRPSDPAALARRENLPLAKNPCPVSGKTKRNEMAELLNKLKGRYPDLLEKCRSALIGSPFWPD